MKSKLFICSIIVLACLRSMACGPYAPVNPKYHDVFYLGYSMDGNWQEHLDSAFREENIDFWHKYVHEEIPREFVEDALYRVYLLDEHTSNAFFAYLMQHNDTVALRYWMSLKATDSTSIANELWKTSVWYYPVSNRVSSDWVDDTDPRNQKMDLSIYKVRSLDERYIRHCPNKDIRNRYVLQVMRMHFYNGEFQACVNLWRKYGAGIPKSALRTQCLNYYGGALLRLGKRSEAATVYAKIGYCNTYYFSYTPAIMREVYNQQPNSKALEVMIQQFVNSFVYKPNDSKATAFSALADEVVADGKSRNLAMWRSAQAAVAYLNHDMESAIQLLNESESMKGTPMVKENIRQLRLLFNTTRTDVDSLYEELLYPDLKWLIGLVNADIRNNSLYDPEYNYGQYDAPTRQLHRLKMLRHAIFLGIVPHFERLGQAYKSIAYLNLYVEQVCYNKEERSFLRGGRCEATEEGYYKIPMIYRGTIENLYSSGEDPIKPSDYWNNFVSHAIYDDKASELNMDYGTYLFEYLDTAKVQDIVKYVAFLKSGGHTPIEKYVVRNSYRELNYFYEIIGTRYMRLEQYATALRYLQKVSPDFRSRQNIAAYINSNRNPFAERWITKKEVRGNYGLAFNPVAEYAQHPSKETFCNLMLQLRKEMRGASKSETRARAAYAYAVALFQSNLGYAWALNRYEQIYSNNYSWIDGNMDYNGANKEFASMQKRVDAYVSKALKYDKDHTFSLKCRILHSKYRRQLRHEVTIEKKYGSSTYTFKEEMFKKEVRALFCDQWVDYEAAGNNDRQLRASR